MESLKASLRSNGFSSKHQACMRDNRLLTHPTDFMSIIHAACIVSPSEQVQSSAGWQLGA